jgi:5-formyltetrahydrofolate cyclo-ligase
MNSDDRGEAQLSVKDIEILALKAVLRKRMYARLKEMPAKQRATASAQARRLLEKQTRWQEAQSVLFFAPLSDELDIWPLFAEALAARKTVALPRFDPEHDRYLACEVRDLDADLAPGRFGIREPSNGCPQIALTRLDFVLVPGVAFDLHGRRLGRGKGYYDRLLPSVRGVTCGVAFDEQIVGDLPIAPHDARVNCILTPTRWIEP